LAEFVGALKSLRRIRRTGFPDNLGDLRRNIGLKPNNLKERPLLDMSCTSEVALRIERQSARFDAALNSVTPAAKMSDLTDVVPFEKNSGGRCVV
jgi:hypothetical protein